MGSSKRFNIQVQHIIVFTIGVMNLKTFQRISIFFQMYGVKCLEQTKFSHVRKKIYEMTKVCDVLQNSL
jgi:hypothetical protein